MQGELIKKMSRFLENDLKNATSEIDEKNRKIVIDYLKTAGGVCNGLSVFWSYAKRLEDGFEEEKEEKTNLEKDDINFFNKVKEALLSWDGNKEFSDNDKKDIERFISNVLFYQRMDNVLYEEEKKKLDNKEIEEIDNNIRFAMGDQMSLWVSLEDTKGRGLEQSFDRPFDLMTEKMLQSRLKKIIKPKNITFLSFEAIDGSHHVVSVYQSSKDNKIYLFDSNQAEEEVVSDVNELANWLMGISNPRSFTFAKFSIPEDQIIFRNVEVRVFNFQGDKKYKYPSRDEYRVSTEEFVDLFEKIANYEKDSLKGYTLIQSKMTKSLIGALSNDEIMKIFEDESVSTRVKKCLVQAYIKTEDSKKSVTLVRYINIDKELSQHIDEEFLSKEDIGKFAKKFKECLQKNILNDFLNYEKYNNKILNDSTKNAIHKFYGKKLIYPKEFEILNLNEAFDVVFIWNEPVNMSLLNDLIDNCKAGFESTESLNGSFYDLMRQITIKIINHNQDGIDKAVEFIKKLHKRFDLVLPVEDIELIANPEFAEKLLNDKEFASTYYVQRGKDTLDRVKEKSYGLSIKPNKDLEKYIKEGDVKSVQEIMESKDFEHQALFDGWQQNTVLHLMADSEKGDDFVNLIPVLKKSGFDFNKINHNMTALELALYKENFKLAMELAKVTDVKKLIRRGDGLIAKVVTHYPLGKEKWQDADKLIEKFIEMGCGLDSVGHERNFSDRNSLFIASANAYSENWPHKKHIFEFLLDKGADLSEAIRFAKNCRHAKSSITKREIEFMQKILEERQSQKDEKLPLEKKWSFEYEHKEPLISQEEKVNPPEAPERLAGEQIKTLKAPPRPEKLTKEQLNSLKEQAKPKKPKKPPRPSKKEVAELKSFVEKEQKRRENQGKNLGKQ